MVSVYKPGKACRNWQGNDMKPNGMEKHTNRKSLAKQIKLIKNTWKDAQIH